MQTSKQEECWHCNGTGMIGGYIVCPYCSDDFDGLKDDPEDVIGANWDEKEIDWDEEFLI